ncbi:MAG: hypothetical protein SGJ09_10525 [Phycisphaerae bacterium]|nr:hypothetical protein [Phycisphaerae bacterium]
MSNSVGQVVALTVLSIALVACAEDQDPRVVKIAAMTTPTVVVTKANTDPRFDEFHKLCRDEAVARNAVSAFHRSLQGRGQTAEEQAHHAELMAALQPYAEAVSAWFAREDLSDEDREALRYIHDHDASGE